MLGVGRLQVQVSVLYLPKSKNRLPLLSRIYNDSKDTAFYITDFLYSTIIRADFLNLVIVFYFEQCLPFANFDAIGVVTVKTICNWSVFCYCRVYGRSRHLDSLFSGN